MAVCVRLSMMVPWYGNALKIIGHLWSFSRNLSIKMVCKVGYRSISWILLDSPFGTLVWWEETDPVFSWWCLASWSGDDYHTTTYNLSDNHTNHQVNRTTASGTWLIALTHSSLVVWISVECYWNLFQITWWGHDLKPFGWPYCIFSF